MSAQLNHEVKGPQAPQKAGLSFKFDLRAYAMIVALVVVWIFFYFNTNGQFLIPRNMSNLAVQMSVTSVLAVGMVLVMVAGHIDLSVGAVLGLCGGLAAILEVWAGWPTWLSLGSAVALGALIGLLQGSLVAYAKIPAFIVTLGGMNAFRGILLGATKGITVSGLTHEFKIFGQGFMPKEMGLGLAIAAVVVIWVMLFRQRASRQKYGFDVQSMPAMLGIGALYSALVLGFTLVMNSYEGIPVPIFIVVALVALFTFLATRTRFGRHVYAIGGNAEAARFSGINIQKRTLLVFVLMSTLAGIAGVVLTGRLAAATISAGTGYELDAIAACVIGGTSTMGGRGTVPGAILGALVMASLDNGMSMMNTESFWQMIVKGTILVLAVWTDLATKERATRV